MTTLDIITLVAYFALNVDNVVQSVHVIRRKSSLDISVPGIFLRLAAVFAILYKLNQVNDKAVLIGHSVITVTFTTYVGIVIYYRIKGKKK